MPTHFNKFCRVLQYVVRYWTTSYISIHENVLHVLPKDNSHHCGRTWGRNYISREVCYRSSHGWGLWKADTSGMLISAEYSAIIVCSKNQNKKRRSVLPSLVVVKKDVPVAKTAVTPFFTSSAFCKYSIDYCFIFHKSMNWTFIFNYHPLTRRNNL